MTLYQQRYRVEAARLENWDYAFPGWYFITICTKNRRCWFGRVVDDQFWSYKLGRIALAHWLEIPKHYSNVKLDEFIVMPNHIHGIVIIEGKHVYSPGPSIPANVPKPGNLLEAIPRKGSIATIIRSYKAGVSR